MNLFSRQAECHADPDCDSGNGENYKEPGCTNEDKAWEIDAYPEFVAELRAALGPDKTICAALPGIPRDMLAFDAEHLTKIIPHMDFFNIMTYDLINRRDVMTKHHAGNEDSLIAVDKYLSNGMPREKAILGFAFYIKWFKIRPIKELDGPIRSPISLPTVLMEDPVTGADLGGTGAILWIDSPAPCLAASLERAVREGRYDDHHKGHYYNPFWTWEDPGAIVRKYSMVVKLRNLGGVFAWDLGGDAKDWSHLKALNSAVNGDGPVRQAILANAFFLVSPGRERARLTLEMEVIC